MDEEEEKVKRGHIRGEVEKGFTAGPFKTNPFERNRLCPVSTIKKDKYDPTSDRLRLVSNFSKRAKGKETGSVNDLSETPNLLSFHAQPCHKGFRQ